MPGPVADAQMYNECGINDVWTMIVEHVYILLVQRQLNMSVCQQAGMLAEIYKQANAPLYAVVCH